jgi:hypothetical protein
VLQMFPFSQPLNFFSLNPRYSRNAKKRRDKATTGMQAATENLANLVALGRVVSKKCNASNSNDATSNVI